MGRCVGWGFARVIFGVLVTVADPSLTGSAPAFSGARQREGEPIFLPPVTGG
jgi:hypothetical protein